MRQIGPALLTAFVLALTPAWAAGPVYPPGSRVGLQPADNLAPAKEFPGFQSADQSARLVVAELPGPAFAEVESAVKNDQIPAGAPKPEAFETAAGTGYLTVESGPSPAGNVKRYAMILPGDGFTGYVALQFPEDKAADYPDERVKAMFKTASLRKQVPTAEQLGLLPYEVNELSGFKTVRTLAPGTIMLADGDDTAQIENAPFMVLGIMGSAPSSVDDRPRFAQQVAGTIPGLRETRITMSEPIRIDSMPGFETRVDGVSGKDNTPVTVVQWLRFGSGSTMRIIASSPRDDWSKAFPRFRAVRDGMSPR